MDANGESQNWPLAPPPPTYDAHLPSVNNLGLPSCLRRDPFTLLLFIAIAANIDKYNIINVKVYMEGHLF
jgi:hypothetical protein